MNKSKAIFLALIFTLSLTGCASSEGYTHSSRNQFVSEFYATVESVEKIKFESHVGEGAAIGAVDGFMSNLYGDSNDRLFGAMVGAFFGGIITAIVEGDTNGYKYGLEDLEGAYMSVILENKDALRGECVLVTIAGNVSILAQPDSYCAEYDDEY